jgi:hypothetical protein
VFQKSAKILSKIPENFQLLFELSDMVSIPVEETGFSASLLLVDLEK